MKEILTGAIKKVTLELIYQVVDERTKDILSVVNDIKKRQEEDFRYLNQKIDSQIGQVKAEITALNQKIDSQIGQVRAEITALNQKIDSQIGQLNQRIDAVIQLLVDIKNILHF